MIYNPAPSSDSLCTLCCGTEKLYVYMCLMHCASELKMLVIVVTMALLMISTVDGEIRVAF